MEDSDDGDYEGLEVDYMSDESRLDPLLCGTQIFHSINNVFLMYLFILTNLSFCFPKTVQTKSQKRGSPAKQRNILKVSFLEIVSGYSILNCLTYWVGLMND